jgi:hypothetical protein
LRLAANNARKAMAGRITFQGYSPPRGLATLGRLFELRGTIAIEIASLFLEVIKALTIIHLFNYKVSLMCIIQYLVFLEVCDGHHD